MSDGELLLRAILDQPKEDTPRLVYADWLEENGRPERAEFIRVQVELARIDVCPMDPKVYREKWSPLRRRERELLGLARDMWFDHWLTSWTSSLAPTRPVAQYFAEDYYDEPAIEALFARGFVSHVTCSWPDWRTHADAILAAHPVERVRLTTRPDMGDFAFGDGPGAWFVADESGGANFSPEMSCEKRWPDIEFELPPDPGGHLREWWENHTQAHTQ
jgi:uncharacterized protein (TIGR02996 family)